MEREIEFLLLGAGVSYGRSHELAHAGVRSAVPRVTKRVCLRIQRSAPGAAGILSAFLSSICGFLPQAYAALRQSRPPAARGAFTSCERLFDCRIPVRHGMLDMDFDYVQVGCGTGSG